MVAAGCSNTTHHTGAVSSPPDVSPHRRGTAFWGALVNDTFSLRLCCSFAVNVCQNEQEITMHLNARFNAHGDENKVVCNSYQGGKWCEEVREGGFPFQQGEEFKVSAEP